MQGILDLVRQLTRKRRVIYSIQRYDMGRWESVEETKDSEAAEFIFRTEVRKSNVIKWVRVVEEVDTFGFFGRGKLLHSRTNVVLENH